MKSNAISFPSIDPMMMLDWLPKLGEKAFLAWLQLNSWRQTVSSSASAVLPLSMNRIIKRLNPSFTIRSYARFGIMD